MSPQKKVFFDTHHLIQIPMELRMPLETILDQLSAERDKSKKRNLLESYLQTLAYCVEQGYSPKDTQQYKDRLNTILNSTGIQ